MHDNVHASIDHAVRDSAPTLSPMDRRKVPLRQFSLNCVPPFGKATNHFYRYVRQIRSWNRMARTQVGWARSRGTASAKAGITLLFMSRLLSLCLGRSCLRLAPVCYCLLLAGILPLSAQDAVRPSLAGEQASEARRQDIEHIPYNLMTGPIKYRVSATFGIEYNDNINLSDNNAESDVIIHPQVNIDAIWPVTQINTLRLDIGLGYAFYIDHSDQDTNGILLSPGSQIAFDVFIGDFRINFHDRFSLQQDPVEELQLSNVADYGRFENTAGVSVMWDLNKAVLTFGYDHYTYIATNSDFDYLDRNAEEIVGSASFAVTNTTGVGLEIELCHYLLQQECPERFEQL